MAEPLKNQFGPEIPKRIAGMIAAVHRRFPRDRFIRDALEGYESLELMPRGRKIAAALSRHLPSNYEQAVEILMASLGPKLNGTGNHGMAPFLYLPHVLFVAAYGLDHFEPSMQAQYELTQRFTAEFSIRPFLERYPDQSLARLEQWAGDENVHVRRLVSEGTRPRLPWAPRLRRFQEDPRPVLALLELLKDDPEVYVRRSVANNLNDIGKDHPELLYKTARRWLKGASQERRALVQHALRSAIKRGEAQALAALGYEKADGVKVAGVRISPRRARIGGILTIALEIRNTTGRPQHAHVDLRIGYIKASGKPSPKVFKGKACQLAPGESATIEKVISLANMTTRKHYPGRHAVEAIVNGKVEPLGQFDLLGG